MKRIDELLNAIPYTAVDSKRLEVIHDALLTTRYSPGVMAEIGVYRGGSSKFIAQVVPDKILYACDSFEGLPDLVAGDEGSAHSKGDFSDTSFEDVQEFLAPNLNVKVIKGFFPDSTIHAEMYEQEYSFVHIDVDLYAPTLACLEFFYPRMAEGGIIVIDDYNWHHTPGVNRAVDAFFTNKPEQVLGRAGVNNCFIVKGRGP